MDRPSYPPPPRRSTVPVRSRGRSAPARLACSHAGERKQAPVEEEAVLAIDLCVAALGNSEAGGRPHVRGRRTGAVVAEAELELELELEEGVGGDGGRGGGGGGVLVQRRAEIAGVPGGVLCSCCRWTTARRTRTRTTTMADAGFC